LGGEKEQKGKHNFPIYKLDPDNIEDLSGTSNKHLVHLFYRKDRPSSFGEVVEFLLPDGTIASNTYFDYWRTAKYIIDEVQKNGADYLGIAVYHRNLV
jgi:hypothetical protein